MEKTRIDNNAFVYPMPMVILGAVVDGRAHHTNRGILEHGQFSISVPGRDLMAATDHAGLVSGGREDKSGLFEAFTGDLEFAPMVRGCPLTMECRLVETVNLPSNDLFIGEIAGAYCDPGCLTGGKPDIRKLDPFTLTMPDNGYWAVGERLGQAWSVGKGYQAR